MFARWECPRPVPPGRWKVSPARDRGGTGSALRSFSNRSHRGVVTRHLLLELGTRGLGGISRSFLISQPFQWRIDIAADRHLSNVFLTLPNVSNFTTFVGNLFLFCLLSVSFEFFSASSSFLTQNWSFIFVFHFLSVLHFVS